MSRSRPSSRSTRTRLEALDTVMLLDATMDVERLARSLLDSVQFPPRSNGDAAHVAVAAANGADYLVV